MRELLSEEGSIYLHLDNKMAFVMKIVMDEIFGENNCREMCIRDRLSLYMQAYGIKCYVPRNFTRKSNRSAYVLSIEEIQSLFLEIDSYQPVSYTHLDVYKRQSQGKQRTGGQRTEAYGEATESVTANHK